MDLSSCRTPSKPAAGRALPSFDDVVAIADQHRTVFGSYTWPEDAAAASHIATSSSGGTASPESSVADAIAPGYRASFPEDAAAFAAGEGLKHVDRSMNGMPTGHCGHALDSDVMILPSSHCTAKHA